MNLNELKTYVLEKGVEFPHLKEKIYDAYRWCVGEIVDGGGSEMHEIELCLSDIYDMITDSGPEDNREPDETCYE